MAIALEKTEGRTEQGKGGLGPSSPLPLSPLPLLLILALTLTACADRVNPLEVTTHPEGWTGASSENFHGLFVLEGAGKAENCATCHGDDNRGGTSGVSCFGSGCHAVYPHPKGFADTGSGNFHAGLIAEQLAWDITGCQTCHGQDYAGKGTPEKNCLTCHNQQDGPEACNTCHGGLQGAPPPDLLGRTNPSFQTVGAHETHLGPQEWTTALTPACAQCHTVPLTYADPGHLDTVPVQAELAFKLIATQNGLVTPVWDPATGTCGNVYCHGAFSFPRSESANSWGYTAEAITGSNPVLRWTDVGTMQAACGTCHGLPPEGHIPATTCNGCHPRVFDADFNLVDKSLHINGRVDIF